MKKFTSFVLFSFFLAIALSQNLAAQESASEVKKIRLGFWNLEWFPGKRPEATIPEALKQIVKVVPAIEKLNADIIGLTEILSTNAMTVALYKSPGSTPQVCSEFLDDKGAATYQQIGIASKIPATSAWWEHWKQGAITPKRGFSFAAFEPFPGQLLLVYTVHLKSNRGDLVENIAMREESASQLLDHVKAMENAYAKLGKVAVVIGGDFNTSLDDPKFEQEKTLHMLQESGFTWCWKDVPFTDRVTLPSSPHHNPKMPPFPDTCFDHAFIKGAKIASASVISLPDLPSDHRPILIELELPVSQSEKE